MVVKAGAASTASGMLTVTNTGSRSGADVAQVYLGASPNVRSAQQPVRALAGYQKVSLRPGQSRQVTIKVAQQQLSYWNVRINNWTVGTGQRTVWAGSSSQSLPLRGSIRI